MHGLHRVEIDIGQYHSFDSRFTGAAHHLDTVFVKLFQINMRVSINHLRVAFLHCDNNILRRKPGNGSNVFRQGDRRNTFPPDSTNPR